MEILNLLHKLVSKFILHLPIPYIKIDLTSSIKITLIDFVDIIAKSIKGKNIKQFRIFIYLCRDK